MTEISKDTLWKGIIEGLFEGFLFYFFPQWASQHVDFSRPFQFLDKEIDEIFPKPKDNRRRFADKPIKAFTKSGKEQWLLAHNEVQGYKCPDFTERMFIYFSRTREKKASRSWPWPS